MSRIHEALKKAEQERIAADHVEAPAITADELLESVSARRAPVATLAPKPSAAPADPTAATVSERITIEWLREKCAKPAWAPDSKTMLFSQGSNHQRGTEEFRTLRTRLYKLREKQPLRTILITSALPAEGKSFVAANLAQVISRQHERKALLIDGDLRKSRLHVPLGAPHAPGLTEYLRGDFDEASVIQQSPESNLFFLPGGDPAPNPAELLANGRFQKLLEKMAGIFDWVIVDSPPAIPVADASLMARMCDGVLFVVCAGFTPYDLAQKACLEFRDKHLLGAVLNRMEHRPGDSYYNGYRYGYGYGPAIPSGKE
ncbi:MAG: CpsD/CapB family tyrosine-protein kinase [Candidatus Acidiferrales bacterium]